MNVANSMLSVGKDADPAVLSDGTILTYQELRTQTSHVSSCLLARGHQKGDRIGLFAENSPFFVTAYLAIIRAGLVAVPLQVELSPDALVKIALDSGMSEVLVSRRLALRARAWTVKADVAVLGEPELKDLTSTASTKMPDITPAVDLAAIMFTSGSTGAAKGVMITHRNIESNARDIMSYLGLHRQDRVMVVLPFHYCFGLSLLHTHLMAGASVVLNNAFRLFPEQMLEEMQTKECTGFAGVPSTYQILLRNSRFRSLSFPKLRWFQQAGGKLPDACIQELVHSFPQVRFFLMYGQTEGTARLSYLPPERLADKLGSIGKGLPSTRLEVLKADGTPVVPGSSETGEIVASGDNVALGYWNDPAETAAFFKNGKLHTGDLARVDQDGFIYFVERERDMIKPGGNRVSAKEVEDVIAEVPDVIEVAVVGAPHELLGEAIKAFVVLRPDAGITAKDIENHCRTRLPAFKTPHEIHFLRSMPHNAAGKILKPKLREMAGKPPPVQETASAELARPSAPALIQST
ncbi:MAG: AMP-dependent synthetase [Verrucomicrobia bacterium]|nr:MAG: AMP-dependent synthetase [Verrucomicrobiota bacterium]